MATLRFIVLAIVASVLVSGAFVQAEQVQQQQGIVGKVITGIKNGISAFIPSFGGSSAKPTTDAAAELTTAKPDASSEAPASEAPASEAPASEAPASEAPASEAPASEAPASEAPASEAPASEAPASEAPASEAPAQTQ